MGLRVGIVDFLNSRPLAWGFRRGACPDGVEPVYDTPARLADMLAAGSLDVGLVPIVEAARIEGAQVLPGLCIGAVREVRSVLLVSQGPIARVRRIALDQASRTSAALVRLLAAERWGIDPEYVPRAADLAAMLEAADAALLIGDPALHIDRRGLQIWDLAAEWRAMTGLPFVFAAWTRRPGLELAPEQEALFLHSLEAGLADLDRIVAEASRDTGLPPDLLHRYFTHHLHYRLGPEEQAGMEEFLSRLPPR
ncbi:MAG: menaquinone biosynthetic enzyme MqnA/MqnD family protein [Thermoanaerobaculia bacterium]